MALSETATPWLLDLHEDLAPRSWQDSWFLREEQLWNVGDSLPGSWDRAVFAILVLRLQQAADPWEILNKKVVGQVGLQVEVLGRVPSCQSKDILER